MNKKLKSLLAGTAIIVPIIALISSQKDANALKISMPKIPSRATNPTVKLKTPTINPIKVSSATKTIKTSTKNSTVKPNTKAPVVKTLDNLETTDPGLKKSLDKLGSIIRTNNLKIVKKTDSSSSKAPAVPPRGDQTYASINDPVYESPVTDNTYENVLTLKNTKPSSTSTGSSSTGLKKRPAYNPNKGKAPQPPSFKSSSLDEEHIYEEID